VPRTTQLSTRGVQALDQGAEVVERTHRVVQVHALLRCRLGRVVFGAQDCDARIHGLARAPRRRDSVSMRNSALAASSISRARSANGPGDSRCTRSLSRTMRRSSVAPASSGRHGAVT
jgi:hypothetical protein